MTFGGKNKLQGDTPSKIAKKYGILFVLPSTKVNLLLSILVSIVLFAIFNFQAISFRFIFILSVFIFEGIFLFTILVEQFILQNPLLNFRRVIFVSFFSNALWILILFLGFIFSYIFSSFVWNNISIFFVGFFIVIAFRSLIYGSLFSGNIPTKSFVILLQPVLLTILLIHSSLNMAFMTALITPIIGGVLIVMLSILFMIIINRQAKDMGGSLGLFRAFLQGWAAEDPKELEEIMEKISIDRDVSTKVLEFNTGKKTINLVIPEVHPGPFYPVGSSNLPMQISEWFHEKKISSLVFHGISNHELNLPSKNQVKNYLSKFDQFNTIDSGKTCSIPCIAKKGKATASCIAFGKTSLLMLTLSPYGMEDFPSILKQKIEKTSIEMGREVIIVDAHNSQGSHISDNDLEDLIAAGEKALKEVVKLNQYEFKIGFAHSSTLEVDFGEDIGPAGFGVVTIEIKDNYFSMISFDSNNIIIGLRGKLIEQLQNTRTSIVEICTTDTHITAGRVFNRKGYIALGERTELDLLQSALEKLINDSIEDVTKTNYQVKKLDSAQKVIGGKLINDFSTAINRSIYLTKIGVISMIVFSILLTALTALS